VILALDLGQRTGWAVRNRDGAIASGTHEFRPGRFEGGGMIWLRFRAWLQEIDGTSGGVGVVVFEEVRRHLGTSAAHAFGGYLAHLTAWAEANKIPYQGVPVGTIKRHIARQGQRRQAGGARRRPPARLPAGRRQRGRRAGAAELGDRAGDRRCAMSSNRPVGLEKQNGWDVGRDPREMTRAELELLGHGKKPLLRAMRARCLDCCADQPNEVRLCTQVHCALWPYRMGTDPWRRSRARRSWRTPVPWRQNAALKPENNQAVVAKARRWSCPLPTHHPRSYPQAKRHFRTVPRASRRRRGGRPMNAAMLLQHAAGVIEHRERIYGPAAESFAAVAARWSLVLGTTVTPAQVALCLIDLKLVRLSHDPSHLDSTVDVAGYAALLREVSHAR